MQKKLKETEEMTELIPAVAYIRMSTDHQEFSPDNQLQFIEHYAQKNGYKIIERYEDEGKSGLHAKGREQFLTLINKVSDGKADFSAILVYDISRWGRFIDPDESAYYQYLCKEAGVKVIFCAESFRDDDDTFAALDKAIKRTMAAKYSQDLSGKVFLGQANLIRRGFRQGGPAGYGLRRQLIDNNGTYKDILRDKEHKSIQTDRVILVPGPEDEINTVNFIYDSFVNKKISERNIADILNQQGIRTDLGRDWTRGVVHQILINEKYIGHNVWNRRSFKLKKERVNNKFSEWIRAENVFEAIVPIDLFNAAQTIINARSQKLTDDEMIEQLRILYKKNGKLSGIIIDEAEHCPSSSAYQSRFGSLLRSYSLVDYHPERDYQYIKFNRVLRDKYPMIIEKIIEQIRQLGGTVSVNSKNDLLTINNEFTASLILSRCQETKAGTMRWFIHLDTGLFPDIFIIARVSECAQEILDYYLFPFSTIKTVSKVRLLKSNPAQLEVFRFDTLDYFYHMTKRFALKEVYCDQKRKHV